MVNGFHDAERSTGQQHAAKAGANESVVGCALQDLRTTVRARLLASPSPRMKTDICRKRTLVTASGSVSCVVLA